MSRKLLTIGAVAVASMIVAQTASAAGTVIYNEDFTGEIGQGVMGAGGSNPNTQEFGLVDWNIVFDGSDNLISGTSVNMTATGDYMIVSDIGGDAMLNTKDPGGECNWHSPAIDITGYADFEVSIYIQEAGANWDPAAHEFQFLYSIDGATPVMFYNADTDAGWDPVNIGTNDSTPVGTETSGTVATGGGSSLEIIIATDTRSGAHGMYFDDIVVTATGPSFTVGDMNDDGVIDNLDINPFVLALTDPTQYQTDFGLDPNEVGDINDDGVLDNLDINPFVALLTGPAAGTAVPEPASLALIGLGGLALLRRRR